jgi:hypothetical protein
VLKQQFTEESEEREGVESRKEKKETVVTSNCGQTGPGEDSRVEIFMEEGQVLFIPHGGRKESESV